MNDEEGRTNMADARPIGVFDSGIGGLTILKEIWKSLPNESTVYFGDSGRMPYGTKSHDTIATFSVEIARFLEDQGVKLLVIACGSASSHGYEAVKQAVNIPVVEAISPGADKAIHTTKNGRVGVIATRATVQSEVYKNAIEARYAMNSQLPPLQVFQKACPLFVSLAEEGWWDNEIAYLTAQSYLTELIAHDIDTLVLGCTHYPLLSTTISRVMGPTVSLVDAGESVAATVHDILNQKKLQNLSRAVPIHRFFTSDDPQMFENQAAPFLGGGRPEGTQRATTEKRDIL